MAPRGDCVNGIDIKKDHISIAQYSPSSQSILNVAISPIDESQSSASDQSYIKQSLKKLISKMQAEGQDAVAALPLDFAIVKKLMVDKKNADLRDTIEWELSQQIIGSIDDYAFDFEPCRPTSDTEVDWYIAAAYKNSGVQKMAALLKAGKLNPLAVDLDIFALVNVFEANYGDFVSAPAIIVHGKDHATSIIVTQNGSFLDFDIIDHNAGLSAPEAYADLINEAVEQSFVSLSQPATFPIFCTGSVFGRPQFSDVVFSRLGNAQMLNPLASIKATVNIPEADMKQCIPFLAVAVGCAIRGAK